MWSFEIRMSTRTSISLLLAATAWAQPFRPEIPKTWDEEALRTTFRAFIEHGVAFTIATDGPEMMGTHLRDELELLERIGALDEVELREANARGHAASFISG